MTDFEYDLLQDKQLGATMGLIVLQSDETLEPEFKDYFKDKPINLYTSRVPSGLDVSRESLMQMEGHLSEAARLFPRGRKFDVVGYGCTSASSIIGSDAVAMHVKSACNVAHVTNPLAATLAYAKHKGVSRLGLLSPYVESVSRSLRDAFHTSGLSTQVFGSFNEAQEAKVARISERSIYEAALKIGQNTQTDAVFISCTNLRTRAVLDELQDALGKPVFSSNSCLAWHMETLANG